MTRLKSTTERLRCRLASAMQKAEPAPWLSLETVLLVLSIAYGAVMRLRARLYESSWLPSRNLPCRVISIGNITTGGTGKTPMAIFIAQHIKAMGYGVAVVSRGYRGGLEAKGGVVSDGESILVGPEDAGDEPYLMAKVLKGVPVLVGRRRYAIGRLAAYRFNPDVIILDDAFQHMHLKRDLDLVLMDSRAPYGNGHVLPRGMLREPPAALERADAVIYTRCSSPSKTSRSFSLPIQRPVFYTRHRPVIRIVGRDKNGFFSHTEPVSLLKAKRAVCFAGLANNQQFFETLQQAGCKLTRTFSFGDHHRYIQPDMERISAAAIQEGADLLVTSLKDGIKQDPSFPWPVPLVVVDVCIEFTGDENRFLQFISRAFISPPTGKS